MRNFALLRPVILLVLSLLPLQAFAGNWGEDWGSLLWGAVGAAAAAISTAEAIPVDSVWMLVTAALLVAVVGALKMRKK